MGIEHHVAEHGALVIDEVEDHRLAGTAYELSEMTVAGVHAGARIDHEQYGVGLLDRRFRLLAHPPFERGFATLLQPRRVDALESEWGVAAIR